MTPLAKPGSENNEYDNQVLNEILRKNGSTLSAEYCVKKRDALTLQPQVTYLNDSVEQKDKSYLNREKDTLQNTRIMAHDRSKLLYVNGKFVVKGEINVNGIYGNIASTLSHNWRVLEVLHERSLRKLDRY